LERNIFWYTGQILRLKCTKFDFGWGSATRAVVGMGIPMGIPVGMGMGWVWEL